MHAPLLVGHVLRGAAEERARQQPAVGEQRVETTDALDDLHLPDLPRVDVDRAVEPLREDDAVSEGSAKPGRQGEAALVVDRVLVLAEKHGRDSTVAPTDPHFKPLSPTLQLLRPTGGFVGTAAAFCSVTSP